MSGIGFLVGYFVMYSIRSGTKTQDAFKSFLGAGGLAGGAFFTQNAKIDLPSLETSLLWGAGVYFTVSLTLGAIYSFSKKGNVNATPNISPSNVNFLSVVLGRILLGEDFRTPAPK